MIENLYLRNLGYTAGEKMLKKIVGNFCTLLMSVRVGYVWWVLNTHISWDLFVQNMKN